MPEYTISSCGTSNPGYLFDWLCKHFPVRVLPEEECMNADFLFCDTFKYDHEQFQGVKILLTAENHPIDLNQYDYCLTHEPVENDRCHRLPFWQSVALFNDACRAALTQPRTPLTADELRAQNRGFCAFVSYNAAAKVRVHMVKNLMKRRKISCGGPYLNNIGYCVKDKRAFLKEHLFSVAYENEATPGYQTEKIVDAFVARSIPLYWGSSMVEDEFNPAAFVHARRFRNEAEFIDHVVALADDYERMAAMLNEQPLRDPAALDKAEAALKEFFTRIFDRGPGAIQRTRAQRIKAVLSHFYGHGLFRTLRRITRKLRGKGQ